jgi:hypothetical protein
MNCQDRGFLHQYMGYVVGRLGQVFRAFDGDCWWWCDCCDVVGALVAMHVVGRGRDRRGGADGGVFFPLLGSRGIVLQSVHFDVGGRIVDIAICARRS